MLQIAARTVTPKTGLESYIIRGGKAGAERLNVLSRAFAPSTPAFLDRLGPLDGLTIVDAAGGGGERAGAPCRPIELRVHAHRCDGPLAGRRGQSCLCPLHPYPPA